MIIFLKFALRKKLSVSKFFKIRQQQKLVQLIDAFRIRRLDETLKITFDNGIGFAVTIILEIWSNIPQVQKAKGGFSQIGIMGGG